MEVNKKEEKRALKLAKREAKKNKKKMPKWKKALVIFGSTIGGLIVIGLFLMYGPISWFRETWITTAMSTMTHQYLAEWFFSDEYIQEVLDNNFVDDGGLSTNPDLVDIKGSNNTGTYANKYEKEILDRDEDALYKVIDVSGLGYSGHLVAIYDPSKVKLATTSLLGETGQYITHVAERENAIVAMNGGGFYDPDWNSNGALPHGTVIQDGKIVSTYDDSNVGGGFIGFTDEDKLVLGHMSDKQALDMGMRDAIEFGPFLVVNGKRSFIKGDGGWGIAPRSAIGQRQDGIVLFLVIDGRLATSLGADMVDLTDIMVNYGAYNAANLDGGSSSALVVENEIINTPVAAGPDGLRALPTFWILEE